ncbi:hypothetical protein L1887_03286 [Cichorium endivia]|nr:hypothetical protein L1887_03286 [Cichorium endivia]
MWRQCLPLLKDNSSKRSSKYLKGRDRQEMGSRDKDTTTPHQPLLSSLVVRPTDSGGGGGGSDYEPGEVRRDPPPYSRSDRFADNNHAEKKTAGART